jgi:hypothetical protein
MLLGVHELERQEEERDQIQDEAQPLVGLVLQTRPLLRFAEPAKESPPRHKRWDDDDATGEEGEERAERALTDAVVPQLAVRLVVPVEVVDPQCDEREEEDAPWMPDLRRSGGARN